ncbi:hypothetical protein J2X69_000419 [Algoriphagus sp. 4150]|nr:hypothetical protein [Algoriphagus sp. 4150]
MTKVSLISAFHPNTLLPTYALMNEVKVIFPNDGRFFMSDLGISMLNIQFQTR